MKKFLFCLSVVIGLLWTSIPASAYDFAVANDDGVMIYYYKSGTNATVTYKDTGYNSYSGDVKIPETVTVESGTYAGTYTVTSISGYAFYICSGLTTITIPDAVTSIGSNAFRGCSALTSIIIGSAVNSIEYTAFNNCTSLKNVVFKDGEGQINLGDNESKLKEIFSSCPIESLYLGRNLPYYSSYSKEYSPFYYKRSLKELTIGENVTSINNRLFYGCSGLTSVTIGSAVTSIGSDAFYGCSGLTSVTIGSAVKSIGGWAFYGCSGLTSINIPDGVNSIGNGAFQGCSGLTSIYIGSAVTSIGDDAFNECTSLKNVVFKDGEGTINLGMRLFSSSPIETLHLGRILSYSLTDDRSWPFCAKRTLTELTIGEKVTSISHHLFYSCSSLTSINIPDAVISIGDYAFTGCSGLTTITIPDAVTSIGNYAFSSCSGLTTITIPDAVTSIGNYAFSSCSGLTSATIGDAVTSIGDYAFYGCTSLSSANIPNSVTSIGNYAFRDCSGLTSATIGDAVSSIGDYAFYNCTGLTTIAIPDAATSIGSNAFKGCSNLKEANIGEGVTTVGDNAFANCTSLLSVDIKGTITSITNAAWTNTYPVFKFRSFTPGVYGYNSCPLTVPHDAVDIYREAWPEHMVNILDVDLPIKYEINTTARADESDIVKKVLAVAQAWDRNLTDAMLQVTELKVIGTINSYDIMALHNKAVNLRKLDLSEAQIVANSYEYYQGIKSADNVIGKYFLYNMKNLTEIYLPNSATYIDGYSISACPMLEKVVIGNQTTELKERAFSGCGSVNEFILGENVTTIGAYAFYSCSGITAIDIPESVTSIGNNAFEKCTRLNALTVGDATLSLGYSLCDGCTALETIVIGDNAVIDRDAFKNCKALKNVTLGDKVKVWSRAFSGCTSLVNLTMGDNVTFPTNPYSNSYYADNTYYSYAFQNCTSLKELTLPKNLEKVSTYAFSGCSNLETVHFSPKLIHIDGYAFQNCTKLQAAILPTTLKEIGTYAFDGCTVLSEVKIPASITSIGDYAFRGTNISNIYTWTIEPTNINQNTFPMGIFQTALLHVPATANKLYYYDTQWSQFTRITNFFDPYEYFYLTNKDLIIDYETSRLQGLYDETTGIWKYSDADLGAGSGLMVGGEEPQYLGNVHIICDGKNSTAIIGGNSSQTESGANLNIDNLVIDMAITKNKWYFYCFPFDVDFDMMQYDGQFVWRYYDGAKRAANGSGGWTTVTDGHLNAMQGYIFQGSANGTLSITVPNVALDGTDKGPQIYTYVSENSRHASWNLVGNPNIGYYAVNDLDYEAPLTTWNSTTSTYEAFRPGDEDDETTLHPYQAFFVQTPQTQDNSSSTGQGNSTSPGISIVFEAESFMTRNQSLDPTYHHMIAQRRAKRHPAKRNRFLINLTLSTDTIIDRTRVVFNNEKSMSYELNCDAAKFMSDQVAQIYTIDSENNEYSINERPAADYIVKLGFSAPSAGTFTISATREDVEMEIYDVKTGKAALLSNGYTFSANKGTDNDRFILRLPQGADGIEDVNADANSDSEYFGIDGINLGQSARHGFNIEKRGNNTRKVYNR